jgi:hypothetical protein
VLWLLAINAMMARDIKNMKADILWNLLLSIDRKEAMETSESFHLQAPNFARLHSNRYFFLKAFSNFRECHGNLPNTDARKQWRKEEVVSWGNNGGLDRKRNGHHSTETVQGNIAIDMKS